MQHFFRVHRSESCPTCNAPWSGENYVGERVITMSDGHQRSQRSGASSGSSSRRRNRVVDEEDEEDET